MRCKRLSLRVLILLIVVGSALFPYRVRAQFLMDILDTTKELGKTSYRTIDRYNHIRISGYLQPQFQVASEKGAHTYSGGDFSENSDNRFMIRRGRVRFDYARTDDLNRNQLQFVFQFDGSERGVFIRDFWGRYWENKFQIFAVTTGMFARPFGYEVNLSSADREAPERGRMSQTLMKTERDLGAMLSIEKRRSGTGWKFLRIDVGLFNGQGLTAPGEFDSYKDFIGQVVVRPQKIGPNLTLGGGVSYFNGGLEKLSIYHYQTVSSGGKTSFVKDSVSILKGGRLPREYAGVNAQLKLKHGWGATELRGEYWQGTQTGTALMSETPSDLSIYGPLYIRKFNGAFICFLQNVVNPKNQVGVKLDFYDPNTKVSGKEVGQAGSGLAQGDIRYQTLGVGYIRYVHENLKLVLWYEWVKNEATSLPGFEQDKPDNVLTFRAQFRF